MSEEDFKEEIMAKEESLEAGWVGPGPYDRAVAMRRYLGVEDDDEEVESPGLARVSSGDGSMDSVSTNRWDRPVVKTHGSVDHTGWHTALGVEQKLSLVRLHAEEGHCYLWLIFFIQAMQDISLTEFSSFVMSVKEKVGPRPIGKSMFLELTMAVCLFHPFGFNEPIETLYVDLINHMMASRLKLQYSDHGMLHLNMMSVFGCDHSSVVCDDGWSARFVVTMLSTTAKKVGATINFDELDLGDGSDDTFITGHEATDKPAPLTQQLRSYPYIARPPISTQPSGGPQTSQASGQTGASQSLNRGHMGTENPVPRDQGPTPGIQDIDNLAEANRIIQEMTARQLLRNNQGSSAKMSSVEKQLRALQGQMEDLSFTETKPDLDPSDSSSNFGVRDANVGRYMDFGTILSRAPSTIRAPYYQSQDLVAPSPVQGFRKSKEMIMEEEFIVSQIGQVNGLNGPFRNDRLNLIAHLHTAMETLHIKSGGDVTLLNGVVRSTRASPRSPSEKLFINAIRATFDQDSFTVAANPYQLPYIEIGMGVGGPQLSKCFHLLKIEYKSLWFQEMKSLAVPDFHNEFGADWTVGTSKSMKSHPQSSKQSSSRKKSGGLTKSILDFSLT